LASAVIHLGRSRNAAHYVTLLREYVNAEKRHWVLYDDLEARPRVIKTVEARNLIATRSVMLFYLPMEKNRRDKLAESALPLIPENAPTELVESWTDKVMATPYQSLEMDVSRFMDAVERFTS
jgi:hypothetical protein